MDLRKLYEKLVLIEIAYGEMVHQIYLSQDYSQGRDYLAFNTADRVRYEKVYRYMAKTNQSLSPFFDPPNLLMDLGDVGRSMRFRDLMGRPLHADETVLQSLLHAISTAIEYEEAEI